MILICGKCGPKDSSEFYRCSGKKRGFQSVCIGCQKSEHKTHYTNNKSAYYENRKIQYQKGVEFLRNLKETTPCKDCGKMYPYYVMEFDHLGDKEFILARPNGRSVEALQKEVNKCDIVCSNCHRERTHKRL